MKRVILLTMLAVSLTFASAGAYAYPSSPVRGAYAFPTGPCSASGSLSRGQLILLLMPTLLTPSG